MKATDVVPTTRRTQAQRSEVTRSRLLGAAFEVLATKGYAGLRVAEVAERAGVSRGAQTHHFPTRNDLVIAVTQHIFEQAGQVTHRRTRSPRSIDDALKDLISDSRDFYFSELFLIALDLGIQVRADTGDLSALASVSATARVPVEKAWLDHLVDAGVPEKAAEDLLWLTTSMVRGMAVRRLWQDDEARFRRLFRLWRQMVNVYLESMR